MYAGMSCHLSAILARIDSLVKSDKTHLNSLVTVPQNKVLMPFPPTGYTSMFHDNKFFYSSMHSAAT